MSNLIPLLKVSLKQSFDLRGKNKKREVSFLIPILLILIFGSALSAFYAFVFSMMALESQIDLKYIIYAMAGMASLLCIATTITKVKSSLFGGNDYDMLAALPIKKSSIIFVKFISIYLLELMYSFIFIIPPTIVILINGCSLLCLVDAVILLILLPIIPLLLASMIGIIISFISDRYRFGNILNMLFYICFLGAIMYMSIMMNKENASSQEMVQFFSIFLWYNPSLKLLELLPIGLNYLAFIGVHVVFLGIMIFLLAYCYDYFHLLLTSTKSHRKYVEKEVKPKGQFKAIFMLDLKRYFTSKMYLMNTITGGILTVLMTIVLIVSFQSVDDVQAQDAIHMIMPYFSLFILWCVGIAVPSAVAINFEGKNFWVVKSLPISYKQYSASKILLSELVLAPFVLIASIILIVFSEKTFINIFMILVLPQLYLVGMNLIGYYINLHHYKLNWSNEIEAVKNTKGMIFSMLIDFGYTIVVSGVLIGLGLPFGFTVGSIAVVPILCIVDIVFFILVSNKCEGRISEIEI